MASYEKRENGTWSVRFRTFVDGVEVNKRLSGYKTKKAAEEAYAKFASMGIDPTRSSKESITFKQLCEEYIRIIASRVKPSSLYDKKSRIKNHLSPVFGEKKVCNIRPMDIAQWQISLLKYYSFAHANNSRTLLVSIFSFGSKYYDLPNPMNKVDPLRNLSPKKEMSVWTIQQFEKFINIVDDPIENAYFTLLFFCGLRRGEALALTWKDYNEETHRLKINKSITEKVDGKAWSVTTPKSSSSTRTILVPDQVHVALTSLSHTLQDDFIFGGSRPMPAETTRRHFLSYTRSANLPVIRIHDLRHSCASHLLSNENGNAVSPVAVAKYLGHTVETLLRTYAHILPNGETEIIRKFEYVPNSYPNKK